jgi:two-component sensor histidine kinase
MSHPAEPLDGQVPVPAQERESGGKSSSGASTSGRGLAGDISHRVKNDLQTLANLLALAVPHTNTPDDLAEAIEGRVGAMSVCYTLVAESGAPPTLDRLAQEIARRSQWRLTAPLSIDNNLPSLELSLRLCSPLSLWLHEVTVNALLHGLSQNGQPRLGLSGSLDGDAFVLSVTDNGHGLPQVFDLATHCRFGLKVAQAVARSDLRGTMDLIPHEKGLEARLEVPAHEFQRLNQDPWN